MEKDIDDVREIIAKSGNAFHCEVLQYLKKQNWTVLMSPYYNDNASGKPREIDLIAEKAFSIKGGLPGFQGNVNVRLFIECKYIPQKTVFWFHDKDKEKAMTLVTHASPFQQGNQYTQKHHYLSSARVAKMFADAKSKGVENEIFYKALNQSLNGLIYYRNKNSIIHSPPNRQSYAKHVLYYPIIACNNFDNLYRVNIDIDDDPARLTDNFQFEINYAYTSHQGNDINEFFLIDIVDFTRFDAFLKIIESDAELAGFFLRQD